MALLFDGYSSCGFQQGNNIGITSSTCRHYTLSNSIMCSDSYPTQRKGDKTGMGL